jgi:cysteinyl-tRNA synthetase
VKIYNTLNRKKEEFVPIFLNKVKIYVCGQTVYDYCHLGHGRKAIVFDMIRRWFITSGYEVTFVENITDIDDKIIKRAIENKETINELTDRFIRYMHEDFDKLSILRPDIQPRATEYIPQVLSIIEDLVYKGYAYQAENKDVYYSVRSFKNYGKLSGKSLDELKVGERVEIDRNKRDPMDFVLWKSSKASEPFWPSAFGDGRPGWHIECSAMSEALLGKHFDIHGGGQDLQFPHHENEIAQSEAHNDCAFANYWLHNGFLNIDNEKMSKSLGNFFTLRDAFVNYDPEVIRFFVLKTHYRSPLNFSSDALDDAKNNLTRLYTAIRKFPIINGRNPINWNNTFAAKFKAAMDDDFNTSLAISSLFELINEINKHNDINLAQLLYDLSQTIGLLNKDVELFFKGGDILISEEQIEQMIAKRKQARVDKDFALSDQIRKDLQNIGIILEDSASGITTWRKI